MIDERLMDRPVRSRADAEQAAPRIVRDPPLWPDGAPVADQPVRSEHAKRVAPPHDEEGFENIGVTPPPSEGGQPVIDGPQPARDLTR